MIDPFVAAALCAATAMADVNAENDVIEFVRNSPAEQRQVVVALLPAFPI